MKFYKKPNGKVFLKLSKNEMLEITFALDFKLKQYVCVYDYYIDTNTEVDLYELLFNDYYKKQFIIAEQYIPDDIVKNCMKCNYYSSCKYTKNILKQPNETNKILKEYKEFINSIKGND